MSGWLKSCITLSVCLSLGACLFGQKPKPKYVSPDWVLKAGLCDPETVLRHPQSGNLIVSNICAFKKNGEGYLSIITDEGEMVTQHWTAGLNAPAGMAIFGNELFVTDFDVVQVVNLASGEIVRTLTPDEPAGAFNDIAIDGAGNVYVSDSAKNRVFGFRPDGESFLPLGAALFSFANGMHIVGDTLFIGGEKLWKVDLPEGAVTEISNPELSDIDGIESDASGGLVISIVGGDVFHRDQDGALQIWTTDDLGSTNHYFDVEKSQVIMPTGYDNTVIAFTINP